MSNWQDVPGWLTEAEGSRLRELAARKDVLEIGAFKGRSTVCMAQVAHSVTTVDHFEGDAYAGPMEAELLESQWRANTTAHQVLDRVVLHKGNFLDIIKHIEPVVFELIYYDACHSEAATLAALDWVMAAGMMPHQAIAVHDYEPGNETYHGVVSVVDSFTHATKLMPYPIAFEVVDRLAVFRRV